MSDHDDTPVEVPILIKSSILHVIDTARKTGGRIPWQVYSILRMNSYEREAMMPWLDDDALIRVVEHSMSQLRRGSVPLLCYDELITNMLAPILLSRLREWRKVAIEVVESGVMPELKPIRRLRKLVDNMDSILDGECDCDHSDCPRHRR